MEISVATVKSFMSDMAELQRRVADLERANGIAGAIPRGQTITAVDPTDGSRLALIGTMADGSSVGSEFYDSDGDLVARIGQLDSATRNGMEVYNGAGTRISRVDERGALDPPSYLTFTGFNGAYIDVTSGTMFTTWESRIERMKCPYLRMRVFVGTDAATTGEMQFVIDTLGVGTQSSPVRALAANTLDYHFLDIAVDTSSTPLNSSFNVWLDVRRTGGAGTIHVRAPFVTLGDYSATATTTGVWTP